MVTPTHDAAPLAPGTDVNGYRVDSVLGVGGMASVYLATQMSLHRPVALKVLHQSYSRRPDFIRRFEQESEALGHLNHPNLVAVIDRGRFEDRYYFVMEFVDGSDLDQLLSEFEFDVRQIIQVVSEVGKGMSYVHEKGIVHRDMKPANILVATSGVIKVSDFGIASIARGTNAGQPITGEGAAMGTGVYMAPEQLADAKNVDHRADIYALGATFYKLITRRLATGNFPAPSETRSDIPKPVDAIILKALDQEPGRRPASVREFCRDLVAALSKKPAKDASSPNKAQALRMNKLKSVKSGGGKSKKSGWDPTSPIVVIGVGALVVICAALAWWWWVNRPKAATPEEEQRARESMTKLMQREPAPTVSVTPTP